jgi:RHS repeat-associated protein
MTGASFQYDAFGRRVLNAAGHGILYDGVNPVQELSGSTVTANLLTGLGVDEVFTRTDSAGARSFLADALGSTISLTDANGVVQTQYAYGPFGATTATGATSGNSFEFTGRENDGTGLYYYRARYYSPGLQRFISEDPIEFFAGDLDLYAYTRNSPTNLTDATGECPWCVAAAWGGITDLGVQLAFNGGRFDCISWKEVFVSSAISGATVGLGQYLAEAGVLGKVSTAFKGASRPTYRFLNWKGVLRIESHPTASWQPNWYSYPHFHLHGWGKPLKAWHLPLVEPLAGAGAAAYNAGKGCNCQQ